MAVGAVDFSREPKTGECDRVASTETKSKIDPREGFREGKKCTDSSLKSVHTPI